MSLKEILDKKTKLNVIGNSYNTLITFQEIAEIYTNKYKYKLLDPPFQASFDEDKTNEMIESYEKNPNFLTSKLILTFAFVTIDNQQEIYLMDGQHRMAMVKYIYENNNENNIMLFAIHNIYSENDFRSLFDELNKDSIKSKPYVSLSIFNKKKIEMIRKTMEEKYVGAYSKTINVKASLYSVTEFINKLIESKYFEEENLDKSLNDIIIEIEIKHTKYFNKLRYLENGQNKKMFNLTESSTIKTYKNVMFFKNNNFINHLINDDMPMHADLNDRKKISEPLKEKVWKAEYGLAKIGICPVIYCNQQLDKGKFGFICGHKISVANGGKTLPDNLRPICAVCNSKMSSTNWDQYEENIQRNVLWKNVYDDEDIGVCQKCNKTRVTKDNFYRLYAKNEKGYIKWQKISCSKCIIEKEKKA
jgi:hypothetical protein